MFSIDSTQRPSRPRCESPALRVARAASRPRLCTLLLILTCISGCARRVPGETFSAGYILAEGQSHVAHEFVVRNTTSEPVTIREVAKSCTCTSFKLLKYQLAPGEATSLTIDVDVNNGYIHKFTCCDLQTDHPVFKERAYNVEFTSLPFAVADPADLNLGLLRADVQELSAVRHVTLDLFSDSKIQLTRASFSVPEEIELEIPSSPEVRKLQRDVWNTRYGLSITLSPKGREGILRNPQSGIVSKTMQLTAGQSESRRWRYSVYWKTLAPLESHPSYLSFGNLLDEGDDHRRSVTISSTTNERFRIVAIKSQSDDIRIDSTVANAIDEATRHRLEFQALRPSGAKGRPADEPRRFISGTIKVQTTDRRRPIIDLPWSALLDPAIGPRFTADQRKSSPEPGS